jgi:hypothetical protein
MVGLRSAVTMDEFCLGAKQTGFERYKLALMTFLSC